MKKRVSAGGEVRECAGTVIYLNGTSSSGKSTVAHALHALLPEAGLLSADEFGEYFETIVDKNDPVYICAEQTTRKILLQLKSGEFTPAQRHDLFKQLYDELNNHPLPEYLNADLAFYKRVREAAKNFPYVIADDLISTEFLYRAFLRAFENYRVYVIKIFCSPEILDRREKARVDRIAGMARFWAQHPVTHFKYDVEVDTGKYNPQLCARLILDYIEKHQDPTAFRENVY